MSTSSKSNKYLLEELLTEFEQSVDMKNETDEEAYQQYAWEQDVDKSWEQLVDKDGVLQFVKPLSRIYTEHEVEHESTPQSLDVISKRGIIRNVVVLFDMSERMLEKDFKPDRLYCSYGALKEFVTDLFSKGPITQMGVVVMRDKVSSLVSQLGANPNEQMEQLGNFLKEGAEGPPSLQNGLEMCLNMLYELPSYSTREVLVMFGSNRTLDAGNILCTLDNLKQNNITVNSISLSPELYILKNICVETGGNYSVARDANHLKQLLNGYTLPPPWRRWMEPILLKVAFPPLKKSTTVSLCVCHSALVNKAYICPQCQSKSCFIPTKCKCCGIYLVSPPDISRAFHHLIPPKTFTKEKGVVRCSSCNLQTALGFKCSDCDSAFCEFCNAYIHEDLHQCPMCLFLKGQVKRPNLPEQYTYATILAAASGAGGGAAPAPPGGPAPPRLCCSASDAPRRSACGSWTEPEAS